MQVPLKRRKSPDDLRPWSEVCDEFRRRTGQRMNRTEAITTCRRALAKIAHQLTLPELPPESRLHEIAHCRLAKR